MELCQIRLKARMGVRTEERLYDLVGAARAQRGVGDVAGALAVSSGEEEERAKKVA